MEQSKAMEYGSRKIRYDDVTVVSAVTHTLVCSDDGSGPTWQTRTVITSGGGQLFESMAVLLYIYICRTNCKLICWCDVSVPRLDHLWFLWISPTPTCLDNTLLQWSKLSTWHGHFMRIRTFSKSDYLFRHVRSSVCPYGTSRLLLDGFLWNFMLGVSLRPVGEIQDGFKSYKHGHVTLRPT